MKERKDNDRRKKWKKEVGEEKKRVREGPKEGSYLLGSHHLEIPPNLLSLLFTISISNRHF